MASFLRKTLKVGRVQLNSAEGAQVERAAEAIAELLDETRGEWLPAIRTSADSNADASAKRDAEDRFRDCTAKITGRLKEMGFPIGAAGEFSQAVSEIHSDLVLQAAFPEEYEKWDESCDELLDRAAKRAREIVSEHQLETLSKLTSKQPLAEVINELADRGPQALATVKSSFHARHAGVSGLSRVALDLLTPNYYRSEESKELGRPFGARQKPDRKKFYR